MGSTMMLLENEEYISEHSIMVNRLNHLAVMRRIW